MASTFAVKFAVYGALDGGNQKSMNANDVTTCLQKQLDANGGVVKIDNDTMGGDAFKGHTKHFGAYVVVNGQSAYYACQEGQTIDFNYFKNGQGVCK